MFHTSRATFSYQGNLCFPILSQGDFEVRFTLCLRESPGGLNPVPDGSKLPTIAPARISSSPGLIFSMPLFLLLEITSQVGYKHLSPRGLLLRGLKLRQSLSDSPKVTQPSGRTGIGIQVHVDRIPPSSMSLNEDGTQAPLAPPDTPPILNFPAPVQSLHSQPPLVPGKANCLGTSHSPIWPYPITLFVFASAVSSAMATHCGPSNVHLHPSLRPPPDELQL